MLDWLLGYNYSVMADTEPGRERSHRIASSPGPVVACISSLEHITTFFQEFGELVVKILIVGNWPRGEHLFHRNRKMRQIWFVLFCWELVYRHTSEPWSPDAKF